MSVGFPVIVNVRHFALALARDPEIPQSEKFTELALLPARHARSKRLGIKRNGRARGNVDGGKGAGGFCLRQAYLRLKVGVRTVF